MKLLAQIFFVLGVSFISYGYMHIINKPSQPSPTSKRPANKSTPRSASEPSQRVPVPTRPVSAQKEQASLSKTQQAIQSERTALPSRAIDPGTDRTTSSVQVMGTSPNDNAKTGSKTSKLPYDSSDMSLLDKASRDAKAEGSRIAYIGSVETLYAFEPRFFEKTADESGRPAELHRLVSSVETVESSQGKQRLLVQRKAIPVPDDAEPNYQIWHRAIVHAVESGAKVINLASNHVDRDELASSITYARSRGVVVISVPPQGH